MARHESPVSGRQARDPEPALVVGSDRELRHRPADEIVARLEETREPMLGKGSGARYLGARDGASQ